MKNRGAHNGHRRQNRKCADAPRCLGCDSPGNSRLRWRTGTGGLPLEAQDGAAWLNRNWRRRLGRSNALEGETHGLSTVEADHLQALSALAHIHGRRIAPAGIAALACDGRRQIFCFAARQNPAIHDTENVRVSQLQRAPHLTGTVFGGWNTSEGGAQDYGRGTIRTAKCRSDQAGWDSVQRRHLCSQFRPDRISRLFCVVHFLAAQTICSPRHSREAFVRDGLLAVEANSELAVFNAL